MRRDARGRRIELGDVVARPYSTDDLLFLPGRIKWAMLGRVTTITEDFQGGIVFVDGIIYGTKDIVTLSGLEAVTCDGCGSSWLFDTRRMSTKEECPGCGALFCFAGEADVPEDHS